MCYGMSPVHRSHPVVDTHPCTFLALGPQLRNLYRHGEKKDCTWKWNDFKYCLSLKTEDETARRDLWVKRRAEWWTKRRVGQSSEDIWDVRK